MKAISHQHFRVPSLDGLDEFYRDLLGMEPLEHSENSRTYHYPDRGCRLVFKLLDLRAFEARSNDFYWKIGITVPDLDAAVSHLRGRGLEVSDQKQFLDIGYMSKITDPNGFIIELLQQGFEGDALPVTGDHPMREQAIIAHITLRVTNIAAARRFFEQEMGMRLMTVQPVEQFGFDLYFHSWSDDTLPDPDLEAVANRAWLWQRPYTLIELQHLKQADAAVYKTPDDQAGFDGFSCTDQTPGEALFVSAKRLHALS